MIFSSRWSNQKGSHITWYHYNNVQNCIFSEKKTFQVDFILQLGDGYFGRTDMETCLEANEDLPAARELPCDSVKANDIEVIQKCAGRRQCTFPLTTSHLGITPCPSSTSWDNSLPFKHIYQVPKHDILLQE